MCARTWAAPVQGRSLRRAGWWRWSSGRRDARDSSGPLGSADSPTSDSPEPSVSSANESAAGHSADQPAVGRSSTCGRSGAGASGGWCPASPVSPPPVTFAVPSHAPSPRAAGAGIREMEALSAQVLLKDAVLLRSRGSLQAVGDSPIPRGPRAESAIGCRASAESTGRRSSAETAAEIPDTTGIVRGGDHPAELKCLLCYSQPGCLTLA